MMSNILIIDGNNRMHASYHAYRRLSHKGKSVATIYGLPSMIKALMSKFDPEQVYIVWDGCHAKERVALLPNYKKRDKIKGLVDMGDMYRQRDVVMKMFYFLGVRQILNPRMEADDNIYYLQRVLRKKKPNSHIIIVSGDKDFHQLVDNRVSIWDDNKKLIYDKETLYQYLGYHPKQTVDYLSLLGDTSDNIPGYPGIGKVKAKDFLEQFGSISSYLYNPMNKFSIVDRKKLLEIYRTNKELIDLKYFYQKYIKGQEKLLFFKNKSKPRVREDAFNKICSKYNLNKIRGKSFIEPFKNLK